MLTPLGRSAARLRFRRAACSSDELAAVTPSGGKRRIGVMAFTRIPFTISAPPDLSQARDLDGLPVTFL
jgi:hypothetical protein